MVSEIELRQRLASLINGDASLDAFEDWFTVASWNAHKDSSPSALALVGAVELRLDEHSSAHLPYSELLHELEALVRAEPLQISLSLSNNVSMSVNVNITAQHPLSPLQRCQGFQRLMAIGRWKVVIRGR